MESILSLKHSRKRLFWSLYCFFCCSFVVFCAFYMYSVRQGSSLMYRPVKFTGDVDATEQLDYSSPGVSPSPREWSPEENSEKWTGGYSTSQPVDMISTPKDNSSSLSLSEVGSNPRNEETKATSDKMDYLNFTSSMIRIDDDDLPAELTCRSRAMRPKLILLWTPFFGYWDYVPGSSFRKCEECSNCQSTTDRGRLLESDAVIFHARDMSLTDVPAVRLPGQRWIFYCLESPPYSDFPALEFMEKMFNWTMTYRVDSDILTEYGSFQKVQPPRKLDMASLRESWQWKTKSVVWMTSHCPTHGGRDDFVSQLKKYIDVDEYGKCGKLDCPPDSTEDCMKKFAGTYKFFLAFENSICRDYVTEKFYRTLRYDMVPVVFGGADYRSRAPPGSYVDALAFKSPKHLAYFLTGVGNDFSLYSTYFQWRKDFIVTMDNRKECSLCSMLHKRDSAKPTTYSNIRKWWVADGKCRRWTPKG